MFTGIVQTVGRIAAAERRGGDLWLEVDTGALDLGEARVGDSIAVNGACLTAVTLTGRGVTADVSRETLAMTTLGELAAGAAVNLEPALAAGQPLGGHLVSGHVDGVAEVVAVSEDARSRRLVFELPEALARYVAPKGSVCIDGVSLTVNEVDGRRFGVNIVPHTLSATVIGGYRVGTRVNVEVDLVARYLERLLAARD